MAGKQDARILFAFCLALALLLTACTAQPTPSPATPAAAEATEDMATMAQTATPDIGVSDLLIETTHGPVRGFAGDGVRKFLGIPYAAPPVGDLRWRPPQPPAAWEEPLEATQFGMPCAGFYDLESGVNLSRVSEDCLTLNIWTPAEKPSDPLPVMVWIHGGAFITGSSAEPQYDGTHFAQQGVVLVSINYRLGPFGFLAHPDLAAESDSGVSGNYGILDMIAALEWVRDNVAAFGGDPANVTIFGESSGASGVHALTRSPLAASLFRHAIRQSGGMGDTDPAEFASAGVKFQESLGAASIAEMRALSTDHILKAIAYGMAFLGDLPIDPIADGVVILSIRESGALLGGVDHLVGINRDETSFFWNGVRLVNPADYKAFVNEKFGDRAGDILALLPGETAEEAFKALIEVDSAITYGRSTYADLNLLAASGAEVYTYQFRRVAPPFVNPWIGAAHAIEIPYVFGTLDPDAGYTADDLALSDQIMARWVQFATTGDPNAPGLVTWHPFMIGDPAYLSLDLETTEVLFAEDPLYAIVLGLR